MKIRALKSFFGEGKQTRRGDVLDVDEQRGRMLITRRLATEIDGLAVPKETDKAPFVGRQLGGQTGGEKQQSSSPAVPAPVTSISKSGEGRAKFLCINEGYRLAPFADALYACDRKWWETSRAAGAFTGLKISHDGHVSPRDWNVQQVKIVRKADALQFKKYAVIGDGGNSGFQAINLAVQFGAKQIALVGYDMRLDLGIHWHGKHPRGLNNPSEHNITRWRRSIDEAAPLLQSLGIKVFNCSPVSALTAYPKMTLSEALQC